MKPSLYNFIYNYPKDNTKHILYNSLSGALALVNENNYIALNEFLNNRENIKDEEFLNDLKKGGYIVEDNCNEPDMISYRSFKSRFSNDFLTLTIAPTSDCNFRCIYCYEKNSIKYPLMSQDVQNKIVEFCENRIKTINSLSITWYGGEPLLAIPVIENISNKLIKLCEKNNVLYTASIVTNGYLLTPKVYKKLMELKVRNIQVTIDGGEQEHDKRRPLIGDKPTFKTILDNLCSIKDCEVVEKINIALRVNIDRTNVEDIDTIMKILKKNKLDKIFNIYIARVKDSNKSFDKNLCFCTEEFSELEYDFANNVNENILLNRYPKVMNDYCGADRDNNLVIDPKGDLYKCWEDIGLEQYKVGNILTGEIFNQDILYNYMLYNVTEDKYCSGCKYIPICMGGCPKERLQHSEDRCVFIKYILEKQIKHTAMYIAKNNKIGKNKECFV